MKKTCIIAVMLCMGTTVLQAQKGWQSLFNGKSLDGWQQVAGTAQYKVEDNAIVGITVPKSPNTFLLTEKEYGDFILELEVKIDDTITNSGIQFRSKYDAAANNNKGKVFGYQFELDPSTRAWTGGIYDESRRGWLYPLDLNEAGKPAFKVGIFNKVRIECKGPVTQTFVNGVATAVLVDDVDTKGYIALQVHSIGSNVAPGQKISWRNIRINTGKVQLTPVKNVYVVNNLLNNLSEIEKKNGYTLLFDGVSNKGWRSVSGDKFPQKGWEIKSGEIKVLPSGGAESTNGGDIVTEKQYSAFDFSFQFKLTPGANSGVKYYVTLKEKSSGSAIGPEYQLLDDKLHPDAKNGRNGNRTLASLYDLITSKKDARFIKPIGEWNSGRIVATRDNKVTYYLNGIVVVSFERGSEAFRKLVAESKYKDWNKFGEAEQGHILLQDHGDAVSFRNLKIKEL